MSDTFKTLLTSPRQTAGPFLRGKGGDLHRTLGHGLDLLVADNTQRHLAAFPEFATDETLPIIAKDRNIPIFPEQPRAAREQALLDWLPTHQDAGLPIAVLRQAQFLFFPDVPRVRLVQGNSRVAIWYTLDEDGTFSHQKNTVSNWDWDSQWSLGIPEPAKVHRFFLIVDAPAAYLPQDGAAPVLWPGSMGSQQITQRQGLNVRGMAEKFKSAGSCLWGWILSYDPSLFDPAGSGANYPDGTWYKAAKPGTGEPNWPEEIRVYELKPTLK